MTVSFLWFIGGYCYSKVTVKFLLLRLLYMRYPLFKRTRLSESLLIKSSCFAHCRFLLFCGGCRDHCCLPLSKGQGLCLVMLSRKNTPTDFISAPFDRLTGVGKAGCDLLFSITTSGQPRLRQLWLSSVFSDP